ncbi:unnamed protein product, partial [Polarella glacialis]
CVPVLLFHPDSYPVLPFPTRVPWSEIAIVEPVASEDDAARVLSRLLAMPAESWEIYRRRTIQYAPLIALALENCPSNVRSALSMVSAELQDKVELMQNSLFPGPQSAPPPRNAGHWLHWGPSPRKDAA